MIPPQKDYKLEDALEKLRKLNEWQLAVARQFVELHKHNQGVGPSRRVGSKAC